MTKNFKNLVKDINLNIQKAQQSPSRLNSETHIETHYSQIIERQSQKENLKSSKREVIHPRQGIYNNINSHFLIRNWVGQNMTYLKG